MFWRLQILICEVKNWKQMNKLCMSYLDALELMLLLLLPYLGCNDSVWLIIRLFLTVNSLNRYKSTCWLLLDWWDSGNEVPRSLRLTGTLRYVSRELLLGILKINEKRWQKSIKTWTKLLFYKKLSNFIQKFTYFG